MRCRGAPPPRPSPGRCGRSDAVLLPLLLLLLLLRASPAAAFAPGRSAAQRRPPSLVASPARKDDGDGGNVLSDVDARVLRSILEDEKLDVSTEGGVKRLLEKGTRVPPPSERKPLIENEEGEYASTVLKVRMATPGGTGRLESHVFFGGGRVSADAAVSAVSTAVAIARSVLITHPTPSFIITYFWFTQSRARRPSPIPSYGTP